MKRISPSGVSTSVSTVSLVVPTRVRWLWYGALALMGLRRSNVGGFGAQQFSRVQRVPDIHAALLYSVGNGMHLHFSVNGDAGPLFAGGEGPHGLTGVGESILAGVLAGVVVAVDRGRLTCHVDGREVVAMKARELGRRSVVVGDRTVLVSEIAAVDEFTWTWSLWLGTFEQ